MPKSKQVKTTPAKKPGWPKGKPRGPRNGKALKEVAEALRSHVWQLASVSPATQEVPQPFSPPIAAYLSDADARIASLTAARNQLAEAAKVLGL